MTNDPTPQHEQAPMLVTFGDLAERIARLIRLRPELLPRLAFAPRSAVHATAIALYTSPIARLGDAEVAARLIGTAPRELLRAAMPQCPAKLYRALDRAGDRVRHEEFYRKLEQVACGPFADALLADGLLNDARLGYFEALAAMDPILASLAGVLREGHYTSEAVDSMVAFLRAREALRDSDLCLPRKAGLAAVVRRLRAAMGRIPAPDPGFIPPSPWRLVTTTDELQEIGKRFRNCVALPEWNASHHHFRLIEGTGAYLVSDDPSLLAALSRVAPWVWKLDQVAGPKNAAPPAGAQPTLIQGLIEAGLRIVATEPKDALSRLVSEARRQRVVEIDDFDDEGDAFDDAEAAA